MAGNAGRGGNGVRNTSVITHTLPPGARLTTPSQPQRGAQRGSQRGPNYNSPLYNPTATLSGKQLAQAASQIANVQTQGPIRDYQSQINQNNRNTAGESRTDFNYYMQLAQDAKGLVAQQTQSNADLQTQLQGIAGNTQSQLQQLGQSYQGGALGRMGALGLSGDSLGQLQAQNQQAQGIAAQNAQTAQTFGAQQGGNSLAEARSLGAAGGLAGTEQIGGLARAGAITNQGIQQKINDEIAQRGTLTATALGQLRTQERDYQIAQQGLMQKGQALTAQTQHQARQDRIAQGNLGVARTRANTGAQQALTATGALNERIANDAAVQAGKAADLAERTGNDKATQAWRLLELNAKNAAAGKPAKPIAGAQAARLYGEINRAEALIQQARTDQIAFKKNPSAPQFSKGGPPANDAAIRTAIAAKYALPPAFIDAAFELAGSADALTPATARVLHGLGLRGGTYGVDRGAVGQGTARAGRNAGNSALGSL